MEDVRKCDLVTTVCPHIFYERISYFFEQAKTEEDFGRALQKIDWAFGVVQAAYVCFDFLVYSDLLAYYDLLNDEFKHIREFK